MEEGKKLYTSMYAHCHGEKGDGMGPMIQSGAYGNAGVVPNYNTLTALSEGQIFHSIYYGKGYMGAHGFAFGQKRNLDIGSLCQTIPNRRLWEI